jgi:outer membrane receptor for ferrienterochelin and colicins
MRFLVNGWITVFLILSPLNFATAQTVIHGSVYDAENRGPLSFCNVTVTNSQSGTTTDDEGKFTLNIATEVMLRESLVFSFVGFVTDTVKLLPKKTSYNVTLKPEFSSLNEVLVVSGTMKEVSKLNSPIPVEIYSPALFQKNPVPSIFESLGMINGVQPQLNCNVCNTGDIHINGMEGPYTMILIDGMPIVSSLATVYGLSGIPNSMVKRIEVVKGPASTLYGSEAVGIQC